MAIEYSVDGSQLIARWNGLANKVLAALKTEMVVQTGNLRTYIQTRKLSGQVLAQRSGNLKRALVVDVEEAGSRIEGTVAVDNTAPYGKFQEYGAQIPERLPVRARALRWYVDGNPIFRMRAAAFTLPARPFMVPSLNENAEKISAALESALQRGVKP